MGSTYLCTHPGPLAWAMKLDRLPALTWLALTGIALWPVAWWLVADAPAVGALMVTALVALAAWAWLWRHRWRASPRLAWFALALCAVVGATAAATQPGTDAWLAPLALVAAFAAAWPLDTSTAAQGSRWRRLGARLQRQLAHGPFDNTLQLRVLWKLAGAAVLPLCFGWGCWRILAG